MARKDPEVRVHVDQSHTYELPDGRKRTLPTGWTGRVPRSVGRTLEKNDWGRILPDPRPAAKPAAKTAKTGAPDNPGSDETGAGDPDPAANGGTGSGEPDPDSGSGAADGD